MATLPAPSWVSGKISWAPLNFLYPFSTSAMAKCSSNTELAQASDVWSHTPVHLQFIQTSLGDASTPYLLLLLQ